MNKIAIIIPSRLDAQRLPNKPLKLINNKEMILHVYELAVNAKVGDVVVATPDKQIIDVITSKGGKAALTKKDHQTGTDRVFEVFKNELNKEPDIIINLQGDMPNLKPLSIIKLIQHMKKGVCDIATLASDLKGGQEMKEENICKVVSKEDIKITDFSRAIDFYRLKKDKLLNHVYHHVGIYAFTNEALMRYVSLKRSKLEIKRKLEQLRALENNMKIDVGYINTSPLSVDTEKDLIDIKKIMENNVKK
jgi:3-deoxy-manno-octulosonate cytidylyltransferase (CMP-KDO synthetase)